MLSLSARHIPKNYITLTFFVHFQLDSLKKHALRSHRSVRSMFARRGQDSVEIANLIDADFGQISLAD